MIRKKLIKLMNWKGEPQIDFNQYNFSQSKTYLSRPLNQKESKSKAKSDLPNLVISPSATLEKLLQWRKNNIAPVDVIGCEKVYDQNEPIEIQRYQILVALMLSIQTKDETTAMVMKRLIKEGLRPEQMSTLSEDKMIDLIYEANFNRRKSKNIMEMTKRVLQDGMPRTKEGIMEFSGVGMKVATIYMKVAEGVNDGIGVDTHVHRISNRLGWVRTKNPNETEKQLQKVFAKAEWQGINLALVGFGQTVCSAKKPQCTSCPLKGDCPSYKDYF